LLAKNPLADERLRRIACLHPYTAERGDVAHRKIENDFGHDVLLPAHVPPLRGQVHAETRVGQTFDLGGVGRAAGSYSASGRCLLTHSNSLCTVRSELGRCLARS
jgi:hypothetical protein